MAIRELEMLTSDNVRRDSAFSDAIIVEWVWRYGQREQASGERKKRNDQEHDKTCSNLSSSSTAGQNHTSNVYGEYCGPSTVFPGYYLN